MICPRCQEDRASIRSGTTRMCAGMLVIVRKRKCRDCFFRFTSAEIPMADFSAMLERLGEETIDEETDEAPE